MCIYCQSLKLKVSDYSETFNPAILALALSQIADNHNFQTLAKKSASRKPIGDLRYSIFWESRVFCAKPTQAQFTKILRAVSAHGQAIMRANDARNHNPGMTRNGKPEPRHAFIPREAPQDSFVHDRVNHHPDTATETREVARNAIQHHSRLAKDDPSKFLRVAHAHRLSAIVRALAEFESITPLARGIAARSRRMP